MLKTIKKLLKKTPLKAKKKSLKKIVKPARKAVKPKKPIKKVITKKTVGLKSVKPIGKVTHYYTNIKVAIIKFSKPPKLGGKIRFEGATTDFIQPIVSAQYDHKSITKIPKGKQVGVKVRSRVREEDDVYLSN